MNYITYAEAAAKCGVSILSIFKAVQDYNIAIKANKGILYLNADQLFRHKIQPIKETPTEVPQFNSTNA